MIDGIRHICKITNIMKLEINGQIVERKLGKHPLTLAELLAVAQQSLLDAAQLIMHVEMDGKRLSPEEFDAAKEQVLAESNHVKLVVQDLHQYMADNLQQVDGFHRDLEH